ncbi:zinc finger protein 174-like isoform X3 [Bufo gargarizans]|uniref:zinc finger protein 174-like isoform X3 n=1 Tax=Bufo gargarizans TaxID=30331 RepID=UPI001CF23EFD|nr:zinc finger protein 174-like isoform X3 [Bufo gargarizans]
MYNSIVCLWPPLETAPHFSNVIKTVLQYGVEGPPPLSPLLVSLRDSRLEQRHARHRQGTSSVWLSYVASGSAPRPEQRTWIEGASKAVAYLPYRLKRSLTETEVYEEQPNSATTVRLWKTVLCHGPYTMRRLSTATREKVVTLHQQGLSQSKIAKQTGVSRCAVQALLKKHKETGNIEDRRRSGRPRKLSAADERRIMLTCLQNRKMSSSAISSELAETIGTQVHPSTVRRSLARSGLHGGIAAKKPDLQHGNKAKQGNDDTREDGGMRSAGEETVWLSENRRIGKDGSGSAEEGESARVPGVDTSPGSGVEDDVGAPMDPLRPSDAAVTRTSRIRNHKVKREEAERTRSRTPGSPPPGSSRRAPRPAEHHVEVILCCEICGSCFPTETDLEAHQAEHLEETLHQCEECGKAFQSAGGLKTHKKRKHGC